MPQEPHELLAAFPARAVPTVPAVTAAQMREIDRLAVQDAKLTLLQLLENAGRSLALVVREFFPTPWAGVGAAKEPAEGGPETDRTTKASVLVLAGKGGNGGGALAAARHLRNWGIDVQVVLSAPPSGLRPGSAEQLHPLHRDGVRALWPGAAEFDERFPAELKRAAVVVDGLIGYSLQGPLRGDVAVLVDAVLERAPPVVVSLDVPTGFDATSGAVYSSGVVATATVTLALPKTGLLQGDAAAAVGELLLADVGIPGYIYERMGITTARALFAEGPILRLIPSL